MKVVCRHGHYAFYPKHFEEVAKFNAQFGVALVPEQDYFTFDFLKGLENFSIKGQALKNAVALKNFSGLYPWQVMEENDLVYSLTTETLVPKSTITIAIDPSIIGGGFMAQSPMIQAGSWNRAGDQILSFTGYFDFHFFSLKLSSIQYD